MERSTEYDNQTMQNEEYITCRNDETKVDQVMEERENPSLQTEINIISKVFEEIDEKNIKHILEQLQFKRKKGVFIT
jgi:hypothetical protein